MPLSSRVGFLATVFFLVLSCTSSPGELHSRLEDIGKNDLQDILNEIKVNGKTSALSANPHFVIDEFKEFQGDTARVYQAYAALIFFYIDDLDLCQVRKYRYKTSSHVWDRYEVELRHIPEKYSGAANH